MSRKSMRALYWAPRGFSIAFLVFLSLFAADAFSEGYGLGRAVLAFFVHMMPVFVLTACLVAAWHWEWLGTLLYAGAGVFYIITVLPRPLAPEIKLLWCLTIAGPALLIALLFWLCWRKRRELRASN